MRNLGYPLANAAGFVKHPPYIAGLPIQHGVGSRLPEDTRANGRISLQTKMVGCYPSMGKMVDLLFGELLITG